MSGIFSNIAFVNPYLLILLVIVPALIVWYWYKNNTRNATIQFPATDVFRSMKPTLKQRLRHSGFALRMLALSLLIIALARPQSSTSRQDVNVQGIDIVTALDISGSMLAEDFSPNRLEAAKSVILDFIAGRPNDRIGLVIFSGEAFTQVPLTTDHSVINNMFDGIKSGMIEDGTAIGDGLATAVNRLTESQAISKVIILLTDGENNRGNIDPTSAGEIAKKYGIRVYTIGVGTMGMAPYPFKTPYGVQYQNVEVKIDEQLLTSIAGMTGGKYFRATNNTKLKAIYQEIDKMEKSRIDVTEFHNRHDEFLGLVIAALLLLVAEFVLASTLFRTAP
jgi:Ca-activated chloride channel family protein